MKTQVMFKNKLLLLAAGACLGLPVEATTILNTYPDGPPIYTNGFVLEAQTFTTPADAILSSFQFQMFNAQGQSVQLEIFAWGGSGPSGPALFTSPSIARANAIQDFLVSNINLSLTPGSLYGAVIDSAGYNSFNAAFITNQNSYTGGNMWLLGQNTTTWSTFPGDNLLFQATFVAGAPSSVPEPSAFLLIGGGLTALALVRRYRSERS
jgi:hypothetical protein